MAGDCWRTESTASLTYDDWATLTAADPVPMASPPDAEQPAASVAVAAASVASTRMRRGIEDLVERRMRETGMRGSFLAFETTRDATDSSAGDRVP
jgi:hypothetical protein